jgi:magnesium chelatase family protein
MVANARKIQLDRYGDGRLNSELGKKGVDEFCRLGRQEGEFMEKVAAKLQLSMRGIHKILKVARTIADLEGAPAIEQKHLGEAVALRR